MSQNLAPAAPVTPDPNNPEIVVVRSHRVACDGVGGALGHPLVWLEIGDEGFAECGYCDRRFVLARSGTEGGAKTPGVYEGSSGH
jgi:uncharacterized Zn-finger protein